MRWKLKTKDEVVEVNLIKIDRESFTFEVGGEEVTLTKPEVYPYSIRTPEVELAIESWSLKKWRAVEGAATFNIESIGFGKSAEDNQDSIQSQMPGRVLKIMVKPGDKVKPEQTLLIIEAMKMENEIRSTNEATIKEISVKEGDSIESGAPLILFEPTKG